MATVAGAACRFAPGWASPDDVNGEWCSPTMRFFVGTCILGYQGWLSRGIDFALGPVRTKKLYSLRTMPGV